MVRSCRGSAIERAHSKSSTFSVWHPVCRHRAVCLRTACRRVPLFFRLALVCPRKESVMAYRQAHAPYAYASGARTEQLYYKWGTSRRTIIEANASASRASKFQEIRKVVAPCLGNTMKRVHSLLIPCSKRWLDFEGSAGARNPLYHQYCRAKVYRSICRQRLDPIIVLLNQPWQHISPLIVLRCATTAVASVSVRSKSPPTHSVFGQ
jgi:hypothetical protein